MAVVRRTIDPFAFLPFRDGATSGSFTEPGGRQKKKSRRAISGYARKRTKELVGLRQNEGWGITINRGRLR